MMCAMRKPPLRKGNEMAELKLLSEKELLEIAKATDLSLPARGIALGTFNTFEAIVKAQAKVTTKETADAISDYTEDKISFEKLAERLGVNVYDLYAAFNKYAASR